MLLPLGGAIYLITLSPVVAAACGAVTLLLWLVSFWYSNMSRKLTRSGQDALADMTQAKPHLRLGSPPPPFPNVKEKHTHAHKLRTSLVD